MYTISAKGGAVEAKPQQQIPKALLRLGLNKHIVSIVVLLGNIANEKKKNVSF